MTGNLKSLANLPVNLSTCLLIPPTRTTSILNTYLLHYKRINTYNVLIKPNGAQTLHTSFALRLFFQLSLSGRVLPFKAHTRHHQQTRLLHIGQVIIMMIRQISKISKQSIMLFSPRQFTIKQSMRTIRLQRSSRL